ncbi:MAG: transposase [Candidatus Gastranaerophilaceae bacterium]
MKYKRLFIPNTYVHLVLVSYKRRPILIKNIDLLRESFKNAKQYFVFDVFAICILPDHLHLILKPENIEEYPKIITAIKYYFSHNFDDVGVETPTYGYRNKGEIGAWQRRYWEHTIRDEKDLYNHLDYIHYNPVKHGIAKNVKDWEYSSFDKFVKCGNYEINWGSAEDVKHIATLDYD